MKYSIFAAAVLMLAVSCSKDDQPTKATIATTDFLVNGSASQGNYDFFNFSTGAKVSASDSNSARWDFAMRFETIIVNSNASGPGNAAVQIVNTPFDNVTIAPETGYNFDTSVTKKAIKGADWYLYNSSTRTFAPIAGKTFIFRTATNNYAKLEILSADPADDNGNLVVPPTRPTKIKYKIRFAYQSNGKREF
jgi:hypothetical protein